MSWRLLEVEKPDPYEAYALLEAISISKNPNTLLLRTSSAPWVSLGKTTNLKHVNTEECRKKGIPIVRWARGSWGPIFHDKDILQTECFYNITEKRNKLTEGIINTIIKTCEKIGLTAERSRHRPNSNDILINNKKFAGTSICHMGDKTIVSAPVTLGFDYDLADKILNIPESKFVDKPFKTMRGWITSLRRELGREMPMEELEIAFIQAFEEEHETTLTKGELTDEEKELAAKLREKYTSDDWLKYGKWSPVKDYWRPT